MKPTARVWAWAFVAAWAAATLAEESSLEVQIELAAVGKADVQLVLEPIAAPGAGAPSAGDRRLAAMVEASAPGTATLRLLPGLWRIAAVADGYWSPTQTLWLAAGGDPMTARLRLWPTGLLTGALTAPPGTALPDRLTVRFQGVPPSEEPPLGSVECPVEKGKFACSLPAGQIDLRLRGQGFVSHYRWGERLAPGGSLSVGRLDLVAGASLVGWVEAADGTRFPEQRPELVLRPRQPPGGGGEEVQRRRLLRLTTRANERGFFHFEGLAPGRYQLYAKLDGYATAESEVDVLAGAESELREALVLGPPRTLDVEISPPLDPNGLPWRLNLTRWRDRRSVGTVRATASELGQWRQENLPEGDYSVNLEDGSGGRRLHHRFTIDDGSRRLMLEVPSFRVVGTVRLGGEPLAARVTWGGESGAVSIPMTSDDAGEYTGSLPRAGLWKVALESHDPPVSREVEVELEPDTVDDDAFRVDHDLPATRLAGRVIEASGAAVTVGFVTVIRPGEDEVVRRRVGPDGGFDLRGLPATRLSVHAEGPGGNTEPVEVDLANESDQSILLVLEPNLTPTVVVRSSGGPVPGARVLAMPDAPNAHAPVVTTGVDGRAELRNIPGDTRLLHLAVFAFGFSTRLVRVPLDGQDIAIELDQLGGTIVASIATRDRRADPTFAYLARDGARIGWPVLLGLAETRRTDTTDGTVFVLPAMEPGDYSLCLAAAGERLIDAVPRRCVHGRLDPLGRLELSLAGADEPTGGTLGR